MNKKITIKYVLLQGAYWAALCSLTGYAVTYMLALGYSNSYIGIALAISSIVTAFVQPMIANIADKNSKWSIRRVNTVLSVIMLSLSVVMIFYQTVSFALTLIICVISVANATMQPFLNTLAVKIQNAGISLNYGVCRATGSLSYAIVSVIIGKLMTILPPVVLPICSVILSIVLLAASLINGTERLADMPGASEALEPIPDTSEALESVPDEVILTREESVEATPLFIFMKRNVKFVIFLIGTVFVFYMHMVTSTYLIQIIQNVGGDSSNMGLSSTIAATLELPTMIGSAYLLRKFKVQTLLRVTAVFFSVKAVAMTWAVSVEMIYLAQIFQLAAYALYIPCSVYYVGHLFKDSDMNKAQSLTTTAMVIGSVFANFFSGILIDKYSVNTMMRISVVISFIGTIIMMLSIQKFPLTNEKTDIKM